MSRWARVRWWGKWIGVVACVVIAVAWVGSLWVHPTYYFASWRSARITQGRVELRDLRAYRGDQLGGSGWIVDLGYRQPTWSYVYEYDTVNWPGVWYIHVPLWIPLATMTVGTATVWRLDARARRLALVNHCPKCGYDLAGLNAGSACPECGRAGARDS